MQGYRRYAIYYAPEAGSALDAFGADWLGWDAEAGEARAHPDIAGLPMPVAEITATPRKYGFHGTLKPPFRLAEGFDVAGLDAALNAFAAEVAPVSLDGLQLSRLGHFLAFTIAGDPAPFASLAGRIVEHFEPFRAPLTEAELERRRKAGLTDRQEELLTRWGYPYVMEEFRFHLTLSGRLDPEARDAIAAVLEPVTAPILPTPFVVRELCLFGEAEDGRFHLLHRYALSG